MSDWTITEGGTPLLNGRPTTLGFRGQVADLIRQRDALEVALKDRQRQAPQEVGTGLGRRA